VYCSTKLLTWPHPLHASRCSTCRQAGAEQAGRKCAGRQEESRQAGSVQLGQRLGQQRGTAVKAAALLSREAEAGRQGR
jgi:hypothetical protein